MEGPLGNERIRPLAIHEDEERRTLNEAVIKTPLQNRINGSRFEADVLTRKRKRILLSKLGIAPEPDSCPQSIERQQIEPLHDSQRKPDNRPPTQPRTRDTVNAKAKQQN